MSGPASSSCFDPLAWRPLGRSAVRVQAFGVGTAPLGDLFERVGEQRAQQTLQAAVRAGVRCFDTSPLYGGGLAELRTGRAVSDLPPGAVTLTTKVGRSYRPDKQAPPQPGWAGGARFLPILDYSYEGTLRAFEQSQLRLGRPEIDVLLIHDVDFHTHGTQAQVDRHFDTAMNGAYRALVELRASGAVRAIGVGVNEAAMCARFARAGDFDCVLLAGQYSLLDQEALEDFFPLCAQRGTGVLLGGVFNSGLLATGSAAPGHYRYRPADRAVLERVTVLERVCDEHGVSLRAAALHFSLSHPAVSGLVVGAVRPEEVEQNLAALRAPIPAAFWRALRASGCVDARAPLPGI